MTSANLIFSVVLIIILAALTRSSTAYPVSAYSNSPIQIIPVPVPQNFRFVRAAKLPDNESRTARGTLLRVADGAYPVYYVPGRANGKFGSKIITLT